MNTDRYTCTIRSSVDVEHWGRPESALVRAVDEFVRLVRLAFGTRVSVEFGPDGETAVYEVTPRGSVLRDPDPLDFTPPPLAAGEYPCVVRETVEAFEPNGAAREFVARHRFGSGLIFEVVGSDGKRARYRVSEGGDPAEAD